MTNVQNATKIPATGGGTSIPNADLIQTGQVIGVPIPLIGTWNTHLSTRFFKDAAVVAIGLGLAGMGLAFILKTPVGNLADSVAGMASKAAKASAETGG